MIFIERDIGVLEGPYTNCLKILYKDFKSVPDLDLYYPDNEEAELYTRIIASPPYAKLFINTLDESIFKGL